MGQRKVTRKRRIWLMWVCAALVVFCLGPLGVVFFPQSSGVHVRDLALVPSEVPGLTSMTWTPETSAASDSDLTQVWLTRVDGSVKRRVTFFQELNQSTNSVVARWDYVSSARINFEDDFPGQVIGLEQSVALSADAADMYCVDVDDEYRVGSGQCAMWIYWARYSQFRIYVSINGSDLHKAEFLEAVKFIDTRMSAAVGNTS